MQNLFSLSQCASTNDEVLHFLEHNTGKFAAVYTFNQTQGRGQYGKKWQCIKDLNIAFSAALAVERFDHPDSLFNFYTACIFRDYLATLTESEVRIKWPNDLIIKNKKVAGILTEKKTRAGKSYFIVGLGLNVLQEDFKDYPNGGSLFTQTGEKFDLDHVATELFTKLQTELDSTTSAAEILSEYNRHLFRRNETALFDINNTRQNGIIESVDEEGKLWIEFEKDGRKHFYHQQLTLIY